jgi:hypothetical protein
MVRYYEHKYLTNRCKPTEYLMVRYYERKYLTNRCKPTEYLMVRYYEHKYLLIHSLLILRYLFYSYMCLYLTQLYIIFDQQSCHEVIASNFRFEMDAFEAIGYQIDQELHKLSPMKNDNNTTISVTRRTSSAPVLLDANVNITFDDLDASSMCTVDDLSHVTSRSRCNSDLTHSDSHDRSCDSSEWLDTRL